MSGASVSSFGSAHASGVEGLRPPAAGEDDHPLDEPHTIQLGIFGVLYTVSKEKDLTSIKFAFFRLFLDFLQLWLLVVNPSYGWAINAHNRAWEVVSFIQLNAFLSNRGYNLFLGMFYVFVGLLGLNLALSVWVAHSFSNNRFEYVWPIRFLRWFGLIFYQVLDIATLTLLLVALDCNYFGVPDAVRFHNQEFPGVMCWSMPHIIHVVVSGSSIVLFVIMATAMVLSEMELNPLTRNYMAMAFTRDEGLGFAIKTIVTIASVMLSGSLKALSLVYLFFFAILFYTCVKWVPFIYSTLNYVRCATYGVVLYSSVLLVVLAFGPSDSGLHTTEQFQKRVTLALWVGMGPAALVGAAMCHLRLRHISVWVVEEFKEAEPGTNSKSIYRFTDAREVEIAARCCRRWVEDDTLEPEAVTLSEQIIKAGMIQLPQDPQMIILYSSFLIDVQGSYQSGYTQLQNAKKQSLGLLERFAIFSREQEHTQKASGATSGDAAVDLVSYVEFQRNHRLVVRAHKEALIAIRAFWGLLLRSTVDFNNLSKAVHRIEVSVKAAERAYRSVLVRHSGSARIVRLYGKFLETVKFDPWAAAKWYAEADRLEEEAEQSKEAMQLGGIETLLPKGNGADKGLSAIEGLAFICINAQGQIQVASPEANSLLGYGKNELKGRDLGIIMPHPFSERHTAYVRQYVHTGVSTMLGKNLEAMVVTKSRQVLAVRLHVTKISGLNEDSVFLGMIEPLPPSPDDARLWVVGTGMIVAADGELCDWLGYDATELAGKPLEELLVEKETVREAIKNWNRSLHGGGASRQQAGGHHQRHHRRSSNLGEGLLGAVMNLPSPSPLPPGATAAGGGAGAGVGADSLMSTVAAVGGGAPKQETSRGMAWLRRASMVEPALTLASQPATHGSTHIGGELPPTNMLPPMVLPRAAWRHKYLDPLEFETFIQPGAVGSVRVHSVIVRRVAIHQSVNLYRGRLPDPYYHEMLLVADHQGHVLHVTEALAAALGRTVEAIRAGGLAMLVPEPTGVLHGPWLRELSNPQSYGPLSNPQSKRPPYSCRSGISVSLCSYSEAQGPGVKQFRLAVTQRLAEGGGSKIHMVSLTPRTLDEALSERRMRLTLDMRGTIIDADGATPAELFGADPRALVGSCIAQLIDLLGQDDLYDEAFGALDPADPGSIPMQQKAAAAAAAGGCGLQQGGGVEGEDLVEEAARIFQAAYARRLSRALLQLAKRSADSPDCSWRVAVNLPPDEIALAELQHLAAAGALGPDDLALASQLTGVRRVPAVMKLRLVRRQRPPEQQQHQVSLQQQQQGRQPNRQHSILQRESGMAAAAARGGGGGGGGEYGGEYLGSGDISRGGSHLHHSSIADFTNGGGGGNGAVGAYSLLLQGAPHLRSSLRNGESPYTATGFSSQRQGGGGGRGGHDGYSGTGGEVPSVPQNSSGVGGFGSGAAVNFAPAPRPLQRAAGGSGDMRLVLPAPGESRNGYFGAAGGSVGFQLPRAVAADMRSPIRLDVFGGGGGGGGGGPGSVDSSADRRLNHAASTLGAAGQQGVWGPVMRAPVAPATAATAAAEEPADAERPPGVSFGGVGAGRQWARGSAGVGPVAEATEQPSSAGDSAAVALSEEDRAVLEQLASTVDETKLPSARVSFRAITGTAASAVPTAAPQSAGLSPRSTPKQLSPSTSTGVNVLATAVAATVERSNSTRMAAAGLPNSRSVNTTHRPSFNSTGTTVTYTPPSLTALPPASPMQPPPPMLPPSPPPQQQQQQPGQGSSAVLLQPPPPAAAAPMPGTTRQPPSQSPSRSAFVAPPQPSSTSSPQWQHQQQHYHQQELVGAERHLVGNTDSRVSAAAAAAAAAAAMTAGVLQSAALLNADPLAAAAAAAAAVSELLAPPSLVFEVELWRADLLSGVLEVDDKGKVLRTDGVCPLGQAGLVLGAGQGAIVGAQVSELVPLPGGSNGVAALLEAGTADSAVRGALKKRTARATRLGGTIVVPVRHQSDGCSMDVQVTVVRRPGPPGSAYLLLRPSTPTGAQMGFLRWLYYNDESGLMSATRRGTLQSTSAVGGSGGASGSGIRGGQAMSRVTSLDMMAAAAAAAAGGGGAAAAATGGITSPQPPLPSATGLASMILADKAAASVPAGVADSALLHSEILSFSAAAAVARTTGVSLLAATSAAALPPQPPLVQPIDPLPVSGSLRVAALRSSLIGVNGAVPSRLSIISMAGQQPAAPGGAAVADTYGPMEDIAAEVPGLASGVDTGAASAIGATVLTTTIETAVARNGSAAAGVDPEALARTVSQDTAFERGARGARTMESSNDDPLLQTAAPLHGASLGIPSSVTRTTAPQLPPTTPRQSASLLLLGAEQSGGSLLMGSTTRRSRMPDVRHSMVQSWVLSDGREHTPGDALGAADSQPETVLPSPELGVKGLLPQALPSPAGFQPNGGGGYGGGGDDDRMSGFADGDGRSSEDPGGSGGGGDGPAGEVGIGRGSGGGGGADDSTRDGDKEEVESEAGATVANYSVGKRFKKLYRILMSPLAMQPARRLRWRTLTAVVLILAAHTVTFTLLIVKLIQQQAAVEDLHSVANAARNVHEIAIGGRVLESLYSGKSYAPGLKTFGDPNPEALASAYGMVLEATTSLKKLHHGVYLGFRSLRRIPDSNGLRDIWDKPLLNMTLYYDLDDPEKPGMAYLPTAANNGTGLNTSGWLPSAVMPVGLWDAGNFYLSSAYDLISLGPNMSAQGSNFSDWSTWKIIHDNGVSVIFTAYLATLDALVGITVAESRSIYQLQLIVLCLEGGMLCILACIYMWIVAHQYSHKRHDLYEVFLAIPIGVTRGLANMSLNLEAVNEDEDSDSDLAPQDAAAAAGGGNTIMTTAIDSETMLTDGAVKAAAAGGDRRSVAGAVAAAMQQRRRASFTLGLKTLSSGNGDDFGDGGGADGSLRGGGATAAATGVVGAISTRLHAVPSIVASLAIWRRRARVAPHSSSGPPSGLGGRPKRRLLESHKLAYKLVAPFIMWGAAIIVVNLLGYHHLKALTAPIATLNIVNVVIIRFHRLQFFVLEVAAALTAALCNMLKPTLAAELAAWRLEYHAMLYGNEQVTSKQDDAHFRLATTGVLFGGYDTPAALLFHTGSCLAMDPADCQPPDSPYYQATRNGLDVLMKASLVHVDSLVNQPPEVSGLNSSEFRFLWTTGLTDAKGGLMQVGDVFLHAVHDSYGVVVIQQIVMFVCAWVVTMLFLIVQLRPLVRSAENEMRRVAELLSQLPPEVDCEGMVTAVVLHGEQLQQHGAKGKGAGGGGGGGGGLTTANYGFAGSAGAGGIGKQGHLSDMGAAALTLVRRKSSMGGGLIRGDAANAKEAD
ncbi:hypothetical protein PLESTF_001017600 [Pleodorina starrii]|nr:hypothetical protein PLESTF_001017600 [Pleodorina starrii]